MLENLRPSLKVENAMKSFRTVLFWIHLAIGAAAGIVIFIMSVTGVALTYEKQLIEWADRTAWTE